LNRFHRLDLSLSTRKDRVSLKWVDLFPPLPGKARPRPNMHRYVLLRAEGEPHWKAPSRRVAVLGGARMSYEDRDVKSGVVYHYPVQGQDAKGQLKATSEGWNVHHSTQPPLVEDVVASVVSEKRVDLSWSAPGCRDLDGYHVERAVVEVWSDDQLHREKQ